MLLAGDKLPPTRRPNGSLDTPTPTMMIGFGVVLLGFSVLGIFVPDSLPGIVGSAGGSAIGVGIAMRWNRRRADVDSNASGLNRGAST